MAKTTEFEFAAAPLWEVGLSAFTAAQLLDTYHIKEIHDLFKAELPRHERQLPLSIQQMQPFPPPGMQMFIGPMIIPTFNQIDPVRYWFLDPAGELIAQIQDNFIARNWRRLQLEKDLNAPYPGFDAMLAGFRDQIQRVESWGLQRGTPLSPPAICELLYDNLIPLTRLDGTSFAISDLMSPVNPVGLLMNWGSQWMEWIDGKPVDGQPADIQVNLQMVTQPSLSGGTRNYIKFMLIARSAQQTWSGVYTFLERAHTRIRARFMELTTEVAHECWRAS